MWSRRAKATTATRRPAGPARAGRNLHAHPQAIRTTFPRAGLGRQSRRRHRALRGDDVFLEIGPGPGILTLKLAPQSVAAGRHRDRSRSHREPHTQASGQRVDRRPATSSRSTSSAALSPIDASTPHSHRRQPSLQHLVADPVPAPRTAVAGASSPTPRSCFSARSPTGSSPSPGTAEYGVLSVLIQWRAEVTRLLALPPGAFRPPPDGALGACPARLSAASLSSRPTSASSSGWCAACSRSVARPSRMPWRRLPPSTGRLTGRRAAPCRHRSAPPAGDAGDR